MRISRNFLIIFLVITSLLTLIAPLFSSYLVSQLIHKNFTSNPIKINDTQIKLLDYQRGFWQSSARVAIQMRLPSDKKYQATFDLIINHSPFINAGSNLLRLQAVRKDIDDPNERYSDILKFDNLRAIVRLSLLGKFFVDVNAKKMQLMDRFVFIHPSLHANSTLYHPNHVVIQAQLPQLLDANNNYEPVINDANTTITLNFLSNIQQLAAEAVFFAKRLNPSGKFLLNDAHVALSLTPNSDEISHTLHTALSANPVAPEITPIKQFTIQNETMNYTTTPVLPDSVNFDATLANISSYWLAKLQNNFKDTKINSLKFLLKLSDLLITSNIETSADLTLKKGEKIWLNAELAASENIKNPAQILLALKSHNPNAMLTLIEKASLNITASSGNDNQVRANLEHLFETLHFPILWLPSDDNYLQSQWKIDNGQLFQNNRVMPLPVY